jgi:xylulokinase
VPDLVLGIDIGTSATKAVLTTRDGEIVGRASRAHAVDMPRPGWVEQDASAWWHGIRHVTSELGHGAEITAVGVSGMGPCVLPTDEALTPLAPAILYGVDTRAVDLIAQIEDELGAGEIAKRCGTRLTSQAGGPKLRWLAEHQPDTRRVATASSYAVARLTGEYVLDHHTASQYDPLYDLRTNAWIEDWAAKLAPDIELPPLAWPGDVVGAVTAHAAAETGLNPGTPVIAGTVDAWAEALSAGVTEPGELMLMYGSTMFLVAPTREPRFDPRLWCTTGTHEGTYSVAGGMATSGSLTAWMQELTGGAAYEDLLDEAAATPPGADGLVVLPYFLGERTPLFDPDARGVIAGLTLRHTRGHLYRAVLEATAYAVRHHLEVLDEPIDRIVAVGGGARTPLWPQIVSDVTGLPQDLPHETVGAAYGTAMLAAGDRGTWARTAATVTPDDEHRRTYDEQYRIFRDLYPATKAQAHALAALQSPESHDALQEEENPLASHP